MEKITIGNCTLYNADCRDVLPELGRFDLLCYTAYVLFTYWIRNENFKRNADWKSWRIFSMR